MTATPSTVSRRRSPRRNSRALDEALLAAMIDGDDTPSTIAESMELSLLELAGWASRPANAQALSRLAQLLDLRAQMVVSRYRAHAAAMLVGIASGDREGSEIMRKACVDLLKADLNVLRRESAPDAEPDAAPADTKSILRALERIGAAEDPTSASA